MFEIAGIAPAQLLLVTGIALLSSVLGGLSGFGAGMVVVPFLLPIVGIKGVVPVIAVAMLIGNAARFNVYRSEVRRETVIRMLLMILPGAILGVWIYDALPPRIVAVVIGSVLILSIPVRRWLAQREIRPTRNGVAAAAFGAGLIAGNAPGGGVLIITLLLSMGLTGPALLGTDAAIGTILSMTNAALFGGLGLLDMSRLIIGVTLGLAMIPGAYIARFFLTRLQTSVQILVVEAFILVGGMSFYWSAFTH
tara:strand:- start:3750 stop:4502 length:753 start_codon:yes stop_codon:yes gene_type:complete